ncbi:MAG: acyltransferase [Desulfamplus sp.]|nr:acyltransferase [Desulfamplus sp.]
MCLSFPKNKNSARSHAFDLYRALAVLAVVIGHMGLYMDKIHGWTKLCLVIPINYGVPLFFIISGYLLASSMTCLREIPGNTYIKSLKSFYYLRICRIYPAYIFWLVIFWMWGILDVSTNINSFATIISGLKFLNNNIDSFAATVAGLKFLHNYIMDLIVHIFNIHNFFSQYSRSINPVFWTLAVEFQWYLVAPALFYLMLGKSHRVMIITFGIILLISIGTRNWMVWNYFSQKISISDMWRLSNEQIYIELYSFALGIVIWRFRRTNWRLPNSGMLFLWVGILLIAFYTYNFYFDINGAGNINEIGAKRLALKENYFQFMVITNMKYISQIILAYIVFHYRNISLPDFLYTATQYTAKISYSMYIVHYPILTKIIPAGQNVISTFALYLILTFAVSNISYIFIEKQFIKLRN